MMWWLIAAPLFVQDTARLGSPQPCAGSNEGCYSNYVALADLDGDGDLDAVFASGGGYYVAGAAAPMAIYDNDGSGRFTLSDAAGGFTGRLRQVAIGDIDGDRDLDLVAPDAWAMQADAVFVNGGTRPLSFRDEGSDRIGTGSRAGSARLGDLDGDGDLDLVLGDWGSDPPDSSSVVRVYGNDGSGRFVERLDAVPPTTSGGTGTGPIDLDLVDVDNDFDLDLLVASRVGESLLYVNDGGGRFAPAGERLPDQSGPYVYGPDACDVDGDGDLDLWLDNGVSPLREQLMINDGAGGFTDETAARITGNPSADDNEVQCADVDDDGDMDAVIASLSDNERVLINDGTGRFTAVGDAFPAVDDSTLGLDLGDIDGDGRLDAITAQGEAGSFLNRVYMGVAGQPADTRGPHLRAIETTVTTRGAFTVIRFALSDRTTSDVALHLREVGLEIAGVGVVETHAVGGDLFRAVTDAPLPDTIDVTVHATDAAGNVSAIDAPPISVIREGAAGDGGTDAGGMGPGEGGGCCGSAPHPPAVGWLVLLVLLARPRRRRVRALMGGAGHPRRRRRSRCRGRRRWPRRCRCAGRARSRGGRAR